jgi:hypothetical protein
MVSVVVCLLAAVALTWSGSGAVTWTGFDGPWWSILTSHLTHWTYEQLAWDAIVFAGLGVACLRQQATTPRSRIAFHATLLASAIVVPVAVTLVSPQITEYRGLSGIDSALFALLLVQTRSRFTLPLAIGFVAKLSYEHLTGGTVFANNLGDDVVSVPAAHAAGACVGAIIGLTTAFLSKLTRHRNELPLDGLPLLEQADVPAAAEQPMCERTHVAHNVVQVFKDA